MRVNHIKTAPVPELHIDLPQAVLVIAGNNEPAPYLRQLARQIKRFLLAHGFNDALASGIPSQRFDLGQHPPGVIQSHRGSCPTVSGDLQGKGTSGNGNHPGPGLRRPGW